MESDLTFCGLIGMTDSPREGVRGRFRNPRRHQVVMITGDHQKTAETIAGQLGILQRGRASLAKSSTGWRAEFAEEVADIAVYSRTPDKS